MSQRVCKECDDVLPLNKFPLTCASKKNPNARSHRCDDCTKDYRKEKNKIYYQKRKDRQKVEEDLLEH
jgi:hypothetical protein